jgi:HEPN domain-containing protein
VIRFSQEATELLLKAALRLVGIEYPKVHDVGDVLLLNAERFPAKFEARIPQMAEFSREMASKRSLAMYGVEASGKTPAQIFDDPGEAAEALKNAKEVLTFCLELLKGEPGRPARHRQERR